LIWQARATSRPWLEQLDAIIERADDGHPRYRTMAWREAFDRTALFEPLRTATFETVQRGSPETIVDRVASRSYIAAMSEASRGLDGAGRRRGDRMRIGSAGPLLMLTDYATPCDTQARWFVDGRYGRISARKHPEDARWYASVLEEGYVEPGDEVRLIRTA